MTDYSEKSKPERIPEFPPPQGRCEYCGCLMRDHHDFIARVFGDKEYCALKSKDELLYERTGGTDGGY